MKLVKKNQAISRKVADTYTVHQMLTRDDCKHMGMVISDAKNHKEVVLNVVSDRFYYILEGNVIIQTDDKKIKAEKGDLVFIPANTKYYFEGTFKAVQVLSPPFDPKNEPLDIKGKPKQK